MLAPKVERRGGRSRTRRERGPKMAPAARKEKDLRLSVIEDGTAAAIHDAVLRILWEVGVSSTMCRPGVC